MFRVGQKVVCVDDEIVFRPWHGPKVVKGEIYTICKVYPNNGPGYHVAELPCIAYEVFDHSHFRPVQETRMQMLRALLKTKPVKEVA